MEILLKRHTFTDDYTVGDLFIDGEFVCNTIEDKVRVLKSEKDKVYGRTAIPSGIYRVVIDYSNRFKKFLPHILDVPFFEGIRMHSGNSANDSLGCIIVGEYTSNGWVTNSRLTFNRIFNRISAAINDGEQVVLTIV